MKELNLGNIIDYKDAIEYFADYKINRNYPIKNR